ncbi:hypothetical protein KVV02_005662 [Mortierella alpina]|uniref:Zn(2)-C6 fungal-type domain-containing protein n=1 Tax=Mortierella alpina TaxID=64518 RepID=A0A9P8ABS4_MORAP|nr:hypothetical protein KVV02_005662 [Mortierella alpina]
MAKSNPSSSSAASSFPSTPPDQDSAQQPPPPAKPPAKRSKRPLAKRSCLNCREKKARCELPDLFVPSSHDPVPVSKRCHRCNVLDIDCVVWDGDRKRKPKLPPRRISNDPNYSIPEVWGPLAQLVNAAEAVVAAQSPPTTSQASSLNLIVCPSPQAASASPALSSSSQFFQISTEHLAATASRSQTPSSPYPDEQSGRTQSHASPNSIGRRSPAAKGKGPQSNQSGSSRGPSTLGPLLEPSSDKGNNYCPQKSVDRAWRSVWRTLSVLVDYASQQPQFTRYLLGRVHSPSHGLPPIDVIDMIDRQECQRLKSSMKMYLAWHPHLPVLDVLYDAHCHQRSKASLFLLSSMCLVASRHRYAQSSSLMRALSALVDRLGTQLLLSSMRDIRIVQAFELLLAHDPSLLGTSASGGQNDQAARGNGVAGESVLTAALFIARELGLDRSVQVLHRQLNHRKEILREGQLSQLMVAASLWMSLRLWEGHYVLVKTKLRVLNDLGDLAQQADCMTCIDEDGKKIATASLNVHRFVDGSLSGEVDEDGEKLRSAGRTILVYRMKSMAGFHGTLAKVERVLDFAKGEDHSMRPEADVHHTKTRATSGQTMDKIVEVVTSALDERQRIEQSKQVDMAPFALYPTANLMEDWSQLESSTIFSMLCTFSICSLYTGQFDSGFSARDFVDSLQRDTDLRKRTSILGKNRLELSEKLVSSFVFFNRRMTIRGVSATRQQRPKGVIEATGAPLFLTCSLVVDACKLFLEGAAFVLIAYFVIQESSDSRLLLMSQAAQRLEEFDENQYTHDDGHDHQEDHGHPRPLGICGIAAKYIREMVETMQRWRLASSIYRRPGLIEPPQEPAVSSPTVQSHPPAAYNPHSSVLSTARAFGPTPPIAPLVTPAMAHSYPSGGHGLQFPSMPALLTYPHPLSAETVPGGPSQTPFTFPAQFLPPETEFSRGHGSLDYLLAGSYPEQANAVPDATGWQDMPVLPMFDSFFFESFQQ